jgi:hypothetical protein
MPAHWMLGRLGKRVMRPGGFGPSQRMIAELRIGSSDDVVEMWPRLGRTAALALAGGPASYAGIERGEAEEARARQVRSGVDIVGEPARLLRPGGRYGVHDLGAITLVADRSGSPRA